MFWHQWFIERLRNWVDGLAANKKPDAAAIVPWTVIPPMLKMSMNGWNISRATQEAQLQNMNKFSSLDDLGKPREGGLHGWLHGAARNIFNEPLLGSFQSPRCTYFWQLHGLIDHWRAQFVEKGPSFPWDILRPELMDDMRMFDQPLPRPRWPRPPWPPTPR